MHEYSTTVCFQGRSLAWKGDLGQRTRISKSTRRWNARHLVLSNSREVRTKSQDTVRDGEDWMMQR